MKTIALEEHAWTPEIRDALLESKVDDSVAFNKGIIADRLVDTGELRLREMDEAGVDVQVLSVTTPGTQSFGAEQAVPMARRANDYLAAMVDSHPDRFKFFATLPTPDPAAAADELRRTVNERGAVGALVFPRTGDRYLDHADFHPIFAAAAELDVPLYLHPQIAPKAVREIYYDGFGELLDVAFATGGWGWHADAGLAALRLILAGTFDRHPGLQLILGHWGEMLTDYLERLNIMNPWTKYLDRPVSDYVTENVYVTAAGIFSHKMLLSSIAAVGIDRVMFSTDYPFQFAPNGGARAFVENAPISPTDKKKFAHLNAERLLRL